MLKAHRSILICGLLCCWLYNTGCKEKPKGIKTEYKYINPEYGLVELNSTSDTIHIPLDDHTFNAIKSLNVFSQGDVECLSLYDQRSESVNVYDLQAMKLVKRLSVRELFNNHQLYKTSVYIKSFDSIFITNKEKLYLFDSSGKIKSTVGFLNDHPLTKAVFDNTKQPVFKGDYFYMGVRPYVKETSLKELRDWKVLFGFNMQKNKAMLIYHLPESYQLNLFGYNFLDYGYCYNNKGNFVFSFPADPDIYETNLSGYHAAYYGKSQFQKDDISPVSKDDLLKEQGLKEYALRDSYSAIYFDSNTNRYLRVARSKVSADNYIANKRRKKQRLIIFNSNFKIIGESEMDSSISLNTIFFTKKGNMYARVNANDEYYLHFIRLAYNEDKLKKVSQFVKNEK